MIVDSSVILAILLREAEKPALMELIGRSSDTRLSAGSWVELEAVSVRRFGGTLDDALDALLRVARISIEPVSFEQARIARIAYKTYGIGTGHRARLNFGDCFAYALSKATGEPLLFKGDDFIHTDIVAALA